MENSFRTAKLLEEVGCKVRIAYIPNEDDPHDYIVSNNGESFMEIINAAQHTTIAFIDYQRHRYNLEDAIDRAEYTEEVLKVISNSNCNELEAFNKLQEVLDISHETIY